MPQRPRILPGLLLVLVLSLTFSPLRCPASERSQKDSESGSPPAAAPEDLADLAKHLNNPVGPVWNIVTQNNWYFQKGFPSAAYRVQYVMDFQPVLPIPLTRKWNLVMRPVIPLESNPYMCGVNVAQRTVEWGRTGGLGDIALDTFLVPQWRPWVMLGFGPSLVVPTANTYSLGSGMVGLPGDFTPPSRLVRMVALTQASFPVKGPAAGLNLAMTIINNVDVPKGAVREKTEKGMLADYNQWAVAVDLTGKKYYFHTYDNKNWRYVDLAKALQTAKGMQTIPLEVPADYPDVTATAK